MEWLFGNFWLLVAGVWAATLVWFYLRNRARVREEFSEDGTHHCPHCGGIVGATNHGHTSMSTFHIPENNNEGDDLPDNILPFRRNTKPVFDDDGPGAA